MISIGIIDHVEGARDDNPARVYDRALDVVRLADELGVRYAWFAEHHGHVHEGHLPAPLLLALHASGQTRAIHVGTAVICLNLHHARDVAEQVAVADVLSRGRIEVGFGSGATPEECAMFGVEDPQGDERHARFAEVIAHIRGMWKDRGSRAALVPPARADIESRCWVACNSAGAARVAGGANFNLLFSHLRSIDEQRGLVDAYRNAGGRGRVAANRPVVVGETDADAFAAAEPALRTLWRRFQAEGKIPAHQREPSNVEALCAHPINFVVGGPQKVAREISRLREALPFDVLNIEPCWAGLSLPDTLAGLTRFMRGVVPILGD